MSDEAKERDEQVHKLSRRILKLCQEAGETPEPILALALLDAASMVAAAIRSGEGADTEWGAIAYYRLRLYSKATAALDARRAGKSS
jgi:hypothetical protein